MSEVDFSILSMTDKQTLLAEVASGISAASIIKCEQGTSDIQNLDHNYLRTLSAYLEETIGNYSDLDDAIVRLSVLGAKLSRELGLLYNGLQKTANDIGQMY